VSGEVRTPLHLVFGDVEERIAGGEAVLVLEAPLQEPLNLDYLPGCCFKGFSARGPTCRRSWLIRVKVSGGNPMARLSW
jgi:hypothetical protein